MQTNSEFPVAINLHGKALDEKVLRWAWNVGLFESPAELERCRKQKINWFAAYLFPEEEAERLELIMKFFLGLFLLDDLLDITRNSAMMDFIEGMKTGRSMHDTSRIQILGTNLLQLNKVMESYYTDSSSDRWCYSWLEYLQALQWEMRIKMEGIKPALQEYRINRPKTSGVYLALLLIRQGKEVGGCISELLEFTVARFICLSNDLVSYKKEMAVNDPNNEIVILMHSMGNAAVTWVGQEIKKLGEKILLLTEQVRISCGDSEQWVHKLLLLVGGCEAWTAETSRYQNYINGNIAGH